MRKARLSGSCPPSNRCPPATGATRIILFRILPNSPHKPQPRSKRRPYRLGELHEALVVVDRDQMDEALDHGRVAGLVVDILLEDEAEIRAGLDGPAHLDDVC